MTAPMKYNGPAPENQETLEQMAEAYRLKNRWLQEQLDEAHRIIGEYEVRLRNQAKLIDQQNRVLEKPGPSRQRGAVGFGSRDTTKPEALRPCDCVRKTWFRGRWVHRCTCSDFEDVERWCEEENARAIA